MTVRGETENVLARRRSKERQICYILDIFAEGPAPRFVSWNQLYDKSHVKCYDLLPKSGTTQAYLSRPTFKSGMAQAYLSRPTFKSGTARAIPRW